MLRQQTVRVSGGGFHYLSIHLYIPLNQCELEPVNRAPFLFIPCHFPTPSKNDTHPVADCGTALDCRPRSPLHSQLGLVSIRDQLLGTLAQGRSLNVALFNKHCIRHSGRIFVSLPTMRTGRRLWVRPRPGSPRIPLPQRGECP